MNQTCFFCIRCLFIFGSHIFAVNEGWSKDGGELLVATCQDSSPHNLDILASRCGGLWGNRLGRIWIEGIRFQFLQNPFIPAGKCFYQSSLCHFTRGPLNFPLEDSVNHGDPTGPYRSSVEHGLKVDEGCEKSSMRYGKHCSILVTCYS